MKKRREFAIAFLRSERFLGLTPAAQALYIQICLSADDDGFSDRVRAVAKYCGIPQKAINELIEDGFLIKFDDYIFCVTDWRVNNTKIRKDRYKPTKFKRYYALLVDQQEKPFKLKQLD